jgi:hypothetical protein
MPYYVISRVIGLFRKAFNKVGRGGECRREGRSNYILQQVRIKGGDAHLFTQKGGIPHLPFRLKPYKLKKSPKIAFTGIGQKIAKNVKSR